MPKKVGPAELASLLTLHTVEVEGFKEQRSAYDRVVVGKIVSVAPHPNADRLRLTVVDIKKEKLAIVCGAPNVAVGQMVPLALVGAILPGGIEIKESEIRGEKSYGMICAEDELGLGTDHEGIMVLDKSARLGQSFADYLGLDDTILEIDNKSLSNRGDLWGHYGMAREISALLKAPLNPYPQPEEQETVPLAKKPKLSVKVENKKICSRYIAVRISGVSAIESPAWLKKRLTAVGARPINALVDITNYVMLESGQPLHAFDAKDIDRILIRCSKADEGLETLDGKERLLPPDAIVITDGHEPLALAGIMGGASSAISDATTEIILEAATFDAVSIRKASQKLGLRTDASMRFEKTLDPNLPEQAWRRAWQLIKQVMPQAVLEELSDISDFDLQIKPITVDFSWLKKRLGREIGRRDAAGILERLGFSVSIEGNALQVTPPSWRAVKDVSIKEDILEEVARVIGYSEIPSQPLSSPLSLLPENDELILERRLQDILSGAGRISETYNYSFVSEAAITKLNFEPQNYLRLANPISEQHVFLRQSLLTNMLQNVRSNQYNYSEAGLFEIGRIFLPIPGEYLREPMGESIPYQGKRLGILCYGPDSSAIFSRVKGLVSLLLATILPKAVTAFGSLGNVPAWSKAGLAASIECAGHELGFVGGLASEPANALGIKVKAAYAEINLKELLDLVQAFPAKHYEDVPKYPPVTRDIAFVVEEKILYNDFWKALASYNPLIAKVELFDVYRGSALGETRKSWAFHFTYISSERTLTAEEIDALQAGLIAFCQERFGAQVRDF